MDEWTAQIQEHSELAKDVAKLEKKLNLDNDEQTSNSAPEKKSSSSELADTAELFRKEQN